MRTLLHLSFHLFFLTTLCAQFTEPAEIPNGATITRYANVIAVEATGNQSKWHLNVTIESPDTGCDQYADWWEVLDENGQLIYRRILTHSHINEQPFTRASLDSIQVEPRQTLWIRAHMNHSGYGGQALTGSPKTGFKKAEFPDELYKDQEMIGPLPDGCQY